MSASRPCSFDRVADRYDATRAFAPGVEQLVVTGIQQVLQPLAARPSLLDVGVGTGRVAVPLLAAGVRVTGVDIAPAMLARLRAKCPDLPVALADVAQLPFRAASFDAVLFVHILHLVDDAGAVVDAAVRSLRAGGALLYGRSQHESGPRSIALAEMWRMVGEIAGMELKNAADWNAAGDRAFRALTQSAGATVSEQRLATWRESMTGRGLLDALSERLFSSMWAIPDAVMPELMQRLTPRLEHLLGGLDRPHEIDAAFSLLVAQLPD